MIRAEAHFSTSRKNKAWEGRDNYLLINAWASGCRLPEFLFDKNTYDSTTSLPCTSPTRTIYQRPYGRERLA